MAVNITQRKPKTGGHGGSEGGSQFGSMVGAFVGGATGGGVAGASAGAGIGGTIGGAIKPGKASTWHAIQRRVSSVGQEAQSLDPQAQIRKALEALRAVGDQDAIRKYAPTLVGGLVKTLE